MPTTKHTATAPNGQVFTRSSKSRTYSHVVIAQRSEDNAFLQARSAQTQKQDRANWDYYAACAQGTYRPAAYVDSPEYRQTLKYRGDAFLAKNPDREAYVAEQLADRVARVEAVDFTEWHQIGWSGRFDLAQKLASSTANSTYWAVVEVLPAEVTK